MLADGASIPQILPFLSSAEALRLPPSSEFSAAILTHAFNAWSGPEMRMLRMGDRVTDHLHELGFHRARELVLNLPLPQLMEALTDDPSLEEVLIPIVDNALSTAPDSELSNLHMLSQRWEGSLWELMVVADISPPRVSPA